MTTNETSGAATHPHGPRQFAEWVTFGVSALVVVALAGYLVYDGLREDGPAVPIEVTVQLEQAAPAGERFVVPIEVRNAGRRTLTNVKVEVTQTGAAGSPLTSSFDIDYLPKSSRETLYLYIDAHPRTAKLAARATEYRLE